MERITLDDETYAQIVERALKQIPDLYAQWTDYNAHDPGITMLELLAWLKEMQQFHLDQTGEEHERKFQKLFGVEPGRKRSAKAEVRIRGLVEPAYFLQGSRFFAGDLCFETTEERRIDANFVAVLACKSRGDDPEVCRCEAETSGRNLRFLAFGERPKAGDTLCVGLNAPLEPNREYRLFFRFHQDALIGRNPIDDGFIPLARYTLSYRGRGGRRPARIIDDTTYGMLEDGFVTFSIEEAMEREEYYWLYFELTASDYDLPPVIEDISLSALAVRQRRTIVECHEARLGRGEKLTLNTYLAYSGEYLLFLRGEAGLFSYEGPVVRECGETGCRFSFPELEGQEVSCCLLAYEAEYKDRIQIAAGDGLPHRKYRVEIPDVCARELCVLVETEKGSGCFEIWEACGDFEAPFGRERKFRFEEKTGELSFGDFGQKTAPEGRIFLARAHTARGASGNVKAGSICRAKQNEKYDVTNDRDASGGEDAETISQSGKRIRERLRERKRAVTCKDFEYLAKRTPGLRIESVKAVPAVRRAGDAKDQEMMSVVVKPYSLEEKPVLGEARRKNILRALEPARMIGTKIKILSPAYIGVTVFVQVSATIPANTAKKKVERLMREFFEEIRADFGRTVEYAKVYGRIDALDFVSEIQSLSVDARGKNIRRTKSGDILLPENGLAYLRDCIVC